MVSVVVWYKRLTATTGTLSYKAAENIDQTHLIIDGVVHESYLVKVTATNNENISSSSEPFKARFIGELKLS